MVADPMPTLSADVERSALKEWAVLVDAMARGEIVAMVRKGGIREQRAGFAVRHDRFLLYPTFFHEKENELAPRFRPRLRDAQVDRPRPGYLRLQYLAEAAAVWPVHALDPLRAIEGSHGLDWSAVVSRFHYRDRPGVQVVAVRLHRLPQPVELPEIRRYGGCVSWVELDTDVSAAGARPVLDDDAFTRAMAPLHAALGAPEPPREG
jgi:hypothetical protein